MLAWHGFISLVYSSVPSNRFDSDWNKSNSLLSKIKYPTGFEFKSLDDLTEEFEYKDSGIRIGITEHNSGSLIYHVFVNIKYMKKGQ